MPLRAHSLACWLDDGHDNETKAFNARQVAQPSCQAGHRKWQSASWRAQCTSKRASKQDEWSLALSELVAAWQPHERAASALSRSVGSARVGTGRLYSPGPLSLWLVGGAQDKKRQRRQIPIPFLCRAPHTTNKRRTILWLDLFSRAGEGRQRTRRRAR